MAATDSSGHGGLGGACPDCPAAAAFAAATSEKSEQRPGGPTLEKGATRAGVGRGTVSRAINNEAGERSSTRDSARRDIAELGYVPNLAARSLAGRGADAVALVMAETDWRLFGAPFFNELVRAVGDALTDSGVQLLLTLIRSELIRSETERQRFAEYARGGTESRK